MDQDREEAEQAGRQFQKVRTDEAKVMMAAHHPTASTSRVDRDDRNAQDHESSSYAAALVQSTAKSLLDTSTSLISDEESSFGGSPEPSRGSTLKSLEMKTLPALPDEQDRKRFIGCLAAVLASSYEYDFNLESLDDEESDVTDSFSYFDEEEDLDRMEITQSAAGVERRSNSGRQSSRRLLSLRSSSRRNSSTVARDIPQSGRNHLDLVRRARDRHRRRRYDVFSAVLLSASDLLLLERSQAKAFLPMLARLLVPPTKTAADLQNAPSASWLQQSELRQHVKSKGKMIPALSSMDSVTLSCQSMNDSRLKSGWNEEPFAHASDPGVPTLGFTSIPSSMSMDRDEFQTPDPHYRNKEDDRYFLLDALDDAEILRPFLESISPGAGFRCLSLLLLQHLLGSQEGYDARVRHIFKKVGVIVLVHEMDREVSSFGPDGVERTELLSDVALVEHATRKFEALEHGIASKLIRLSEIQRKKRGRKSTESSRKEEDGEQKRDGGISRQQVMRGLKIGSAGLVAGTLFAVTGGLAAPGIAAGVAAIAGGTAATAAVVTLTSTAAVTAIFGVGGGSLAAYKMQRRTKGLTEFFFTKESDSDEKRKGRAGKVKVEAELFSTICISGWLRDMCDFQRPWGVTPSDPEITDRLELLERFYSIYKVDHVPKCSRILANWKGEENELWYLLKQKYGRDPDHLFPLHEGPRFQAALTLEQDEILNQLFVELGHASPEEEEEVMQSSPIEKMKSSWSFPGQGQNPPESPSVVDEMQESPLTKARKDASLQKSMRAMSLSGPTVAEGTSTVSSALDNTSSSSTRASLSAEEVPEREYKPPKHLKTVWDYQAMYGGELYTVKWESDLLMELSDSVTSLAVDVVEKASTQILKQTALATLLSAVAIPAALVSAANLIDGTWTLACERADEAGQELAKSLLYSPAGRRPITLVGFSMGARIIYACLKELAKYQEEWEDAREALRDEQMANATSKRRSSRRVSRTSVDTTILETMREPSSIVEDAILMGNPNHMNLKSWVACRQVVAGRLINCYSRKDLVLSLMFRYKKLSIGKRVCGTSPITIPGVENVDVSHLVGGHEDYCVAVGGILKQVLQGQPFRGHLAGPDEDIHSVV